MSGLGAARRRWLISFSASTCLISSLLCGPARAEDPTRVADDLFNAARAAYQRGDYSAAARAFDEAQRRAPRAETAYNAGVAWEAAGEPLKAANALRVALSSGSLPERLQNDARERHARLAAPFGELHLDGPPDATIEVPGLLREHPPQTSYAQPGTYGISVEYAGGTRETRTVTLRKGAQIRLLFRAPPAELHATPEPASRGGAHGSWQLVLGIAALGTAGVAAGTGLALGVRGLNARDRFNESGRTDASARDQALSLRSYADVAFAGALVSAAAGLFLLIEAPRRSAATAFVSVGPGSLGLGQRF